jgi:hypothetical protein
MSLRNEVGRRRSLATTGLEVIVPGYLLVQAGYVVLTRLTGGDGAGGLAVLPYSLLVFLVITFAFIWLSGWHRDAHQRRVFGIAMPVPSRETLLSGIGSAMMLCSIPMSYSIAGVSIPLILVLLRGGVLAAAPLVDLVHRRRIHWASMLALLLVVAALVLVLYGQGGSSLPPLALLTVALYNAGFLLRLEMMTRIAKRGDEAQTRRYFVEEKLVALPLGLVALVAIIGWGSDIPGGFMGIMHITWTPALLAAALGMGVAMSLASLFTSLILLNARENTFCVPLERASSLLAGMAAAWMLHWHWNQLAPTAAEMGGAGLLFAAIAALAFARRR